jgi:hypothetical protein
VPPWPLTLWLALPGEPLTKPIHALASPHHPAAHRLSPFHRAGTSPRRRVRVTAIASIDDNAPPFLLQLGYVSNSVRGELHSLLPSSILPLLIPTIVRPICRRGPSCHRLPSSLGCEKESSRGSSSAPVGCATLWGLRRCSPAIGRLEELIGDEVFADRQRCPSW